MALPLLGLLALAGGAAAGGTIAKQPLMNMRARQTAAGMDRALEGVDRSDPRAVNEALRGHIGATQYMSNMMGFDNQAMQRRGLDQADRRLNLATRQFNANQYTDIAGMVQAPDGGTWDMGTITQGVFGYESGNKPGAKSWVGASGLGQIMPANIGPWMREMTGSEISDEDAQALYADDENVQAELAGWKLSQYIANEGLADGLSRWHSGVPLAQAIREGRNDINPETGEGVYTEDYVRANIARINRIQAQKMKTNEVEFANQNANPDQKSILDNPFAPPQVKQAVRNEVMQNTIEQSRPAFDPMEDPEVQKAIALRDDQAQRDELERQRIAAEQANVQTPILEAPASNIIESYENMNIAEAAIPALNDAITLVQDQNLLSRSGGGDIAAMNTRLQKTVLPFLQALTEAGALTDDEFERMAGELDVSRWGEARVIGRLKGILGTAERYAGEQRRLYEATTTPAQRDAMAGQAKEVPGDTAGVAGAD